MYKPNLIFDMILWHQFQWEKKNTDRQQANTINDSLTEETIAIPGELRDMQTQGN